MWRLSSTISLIGERLARVVDEVFQPGLVGVRHVELAEHLVLKLVVEIVAVEELVFRRRGPPTRIPSSSWRLSTNRSSAIPATSW